MRRGLLTSEDPEVFVLTAHTFNTVERQHSRVSRQTRPHCRARVLLRPRHNALQARPVGLLAQIGGERLAASSINPSGCRSGGCPKLLDARVKAVHAALAKGLPFHLGQSVEREVDQHVPRGRLEQREKLLLGRAHGGIAHVVDQADVQQGAVRLFERAGRTRGQLRSDRRSGPGSFAFNKTGMANSSLHAATSGGLTALPRSGHDRGGPGCRRYVRSRCSQADHLPQNAGVALFLGRQLHLQEGTERHEHASGRMHSLNKQSRRCPSALSMKKLEIVRRFRVHDYTPRYAKNRPMSKARKRTPLEGPEPRNHRGGMRWDKFVACSCRYGTAPVN